MTLDTTMLTQNPFTVVTIIAAPAILTNASSVLSLSTSTRFMKCIDRIHQYNMELEKAHSVEIKKMLIRQIELSHQQARHFLAALRSIYMSLGAFALACLFALIGATTTTLLSNTLIESIAVISLVSGGVGALGFLTSSYSLIKASFITVNVLKTDLNYMQTNKDLTFIKNS